MEKLLFALDVDDGWPPVGAEGVWCERIGDTWQLKNVPFFVEGLAFNDVFRAEADPVNEQIYEFEMVQASGHSVVWIMNNADLDFAEPCQLLADLGCRLEGFPRFSVYSLNVPASVDREAINAAVDAIEALGCDLAFPVWRHELP